jgi:hypothetical protein
MHATPTFDELDRVCVTAARWLQMQKKTPRKGVGLSQEVAFFTIQQS